MKNLLFAAAFIFLAVLLRGQTPSTTSIYFETNSAELSASAQVTLESICENINLWPDYKLEIHAHTDDEGKSDFNDRLAQRRAKAVESFLTNKGIRSTKLDLNSYGESQPAFSNQTPKGRLQNRRVDIVLEMDIPENIHELWGMLSDQGDMQRFVINAEDNMRLVGNEGTSIWIDAHSFEFEDGTPVEGPIEISLKECYQTKDMLFADLHTRSGKNMLITGGMIKLEASVNGTPLKVKEGKDLMIGMPVESPEEGMELFNGAVGAQGQVVDWIPAGQPAQTDVLFNVDLPERPSHPIILAFHPPEMVIDSTDKPTMYNRPRKPYVPREPKRENVKYRPGFFKRLQLGKAGIEKVENERFEALKEQYGKDTIRYNTNFARYQEALKKYELDRTQYELDLHEWQANTDLQIEEFVSGEVYQKTLNAYKARNKKIMEKYHEKTAEWRAIRKKAFEEWEKKYQTEGRINQATLNSYFYTINELGWINCDRFYQVPKEEKMVLAIQDNDAAGEKLFLVFESINSLLPMYKSKGSNQYQSQLIPKGEKVKIVAVKLAEGRPYLSVKEVITGEQEIPYTLDYKLASLGELRETLTRIN